MLPTNPALPYVILQVPLERVQELGADKPTRIGFTDDYFSIYVVNEDGHLAAAFISRGAVEIKSVHENG